MHVPEVREVERRLMPADPDTFDGLGEALEAHELRAAEEWMPGLVAGSETTGEARL